MAPHRAEAQAVRDMKDLYVWGEVLVQGVEGGGLRADQDDDGSLWEGLTGDDCFMKCGEAAINICEWLNTVEHWVSCQNIAVELKELADEEKTGKGKDCSDDEEEQIE